MRIIIIGAGKVGYQIAETLSRENFDVVVIDQDEHVITRINEHLDVLTLCSNGLVGQPLKQLAVSETDIVIAVTESDEGNMLACLSAKNLGAGTTIARIRNPEYASDLAVSQEQLSIDYIINPERSTAYEISRMLTFSPAGMVEDFARGKVQMVAIPVDETTHLHDTPIRDFHILGNILVAAIIRKGEFIIPRGDHVIMNGDTIYIIGQKPEILRFCKNIGKTPKKAGNVMILGGGRIAYYLAENLHLLGISVKIIEQDMVRCKELSEKLPNALIINGDGTDVDLLNSENIEKMDAFIGLTGMDEENVLLCLLAKQMGVKKVISKVSRTNYIPLVETIGVDAAITPSMITAGEILRYIRGDRVMSLFLLLGGAAEIMELDAHPQSDAVGKHIKDMNFPKDAIITTIVRKGKVIIPHGGDFIKANDRVIVLCLADAVQRIRHLFTMERKSRHGFWNHPKGSRSTAAH